MPKIKKILETTKAANKVGLKIKDVTFIRNGYKGGQTELTGSKS